MTGFVTVLDSTESWASLALAVSGQLALLALLAWALERKLREPRVRYALWWFVLLAPLVLAPLRTHFQGQAELVAMPVPTPLAQVAAVEFVPTPPSLPELASDQPIVAERVHHYWSQLQLLSLLEQAWLCVGAGLGLRLLMGYFGLQRLRRRSRPVGDESAVEALQELSARAGVRPAELRTSAAIGAGVLCGLRQPWILLPEEWLEKFQPEELRALLAHEVAHVRRRDVAANLAQRLLEMVLFFHPGAWLASRRVTRAREEICDAWAVLQSGDAPGYARCLVRAATRPQKLVSVPSVGIAEEKSNLLQRVEAVMRNEVAVTNRRTVFLGMGALVVCAVGFAMATVAAPVLPRSQDVPTRVAPAAAPASVAARIVPDANALSRREAKAAHQQYPDMEARGLALQVPFPHEFRLDIEEYRLGKLATVHVTGGLGGWGWEPGDDALLVFTHQDGEQLTFCWTMLSVSGSNGSNFMHPVSLQGLSEPRYHGELPISRLEVGKRTPFWVLSADAAGGPVAPDLGVNEKLPQFLARHDLVLVASVTLTSTDRPHPAPPPPGPRPNVTAAEFWGCRDYRELEFLTLGRWHSNVYGKLDGQDVTSVGITPPDRGSFTVIASNGLRLDNASNRGLAAYYQAATGRTYVWGKVRVLPTNVIVEDDAVDSRGRPLHLNRPAPPAS